MNRLIFPDFFEDTVTAFFTGKDPGADLHEICRIIGIKRENIYMPIQMHTDKIILVRSLSKPEIADAVVTQERGIVVGVQTADCVPVLVYAKPKGVIGAVHAGWRGTAEGILKKTIMMIADRFYVEGHDIMIAIGPSIKGCCYEVGGDVADAVGRGTGEGKYCRSKNGKYLIDLPVANKLQALSLGVPESNIWISDECTFCRPERYYSYRFAKGPTGRQAGFIGII
jgi:polyphenol oxidase